MKYKFSYQTTAFNLWQLSMYDMYRSMVGVCNIIFTVAMLLLTLKFWNNVGSLTKIMLIIAISLFTLIQPVVVYVRAKRQLARIPQDMEIAFDDNGIHIKTHKQNSNLKWKTIKGVSKKMNMIIIFVASKQGFILNNKVLGEQKEAFYQYVVSKVYK